MSELGVYPHRPECLFRVKSEPACKADSATAYPSRADHLNDLSDRQRSATTGHSQFRNKHRNVAHRDAGGGAVHSIRSRQRDHEDAMPAVGGESGYPE